MRAWDSWPRCFSSPKENDQAGVSLKTFLSLTRASGLKRWAWVPRPYCRTLWVERWSLAMSSQLTGLAWAVPISARLPASARQCTARARGRLLPGCDLVVMVAIPLVDTNEALPHERCCRCEPMARHGDYWNRAPLPDTEKLPPTQGKLPKRSVFSPCYRRVCLAAQCP